MTTAITTVEREEPELPGMLAMQTQVLDLIKGASLRDVAKAQSDLEAMKQYAKKHKNYEEAALVISDLAAKVARRGGELLSDIEFSKGGRPNRSHDETGFHVKLSDIGISKSQSSRWQAIAAIPEQTFNHHLEQAAKSKRPVTIQSLLKLAPKKQESADIIEMPLADDRGRVVSSLSELGDEKFATIYADPPWSYGNQATRACTDKHYVTMGIADICAMPVKDYAAENAQLHLWTTSGFLREAFDVIEAWGFEYRSGFIWAKSRDTDSDDMDCPPKAKLGIGNYWRLSHEYLLLGIRGSATFKDKSLASWAAMDRGRHSAKPELVRDMVERAFVGPRLEIFGRNAVPGWTVLGNEVQRSLFAG